MADRYYHPDLTTSDRVQLGPEAAHHLLRVLRKRKGDELCLFDGRGREALGRILEANSRRCQLELHGLREFEEHTSRRVELAFSPPKGGRSETLLQMGTELGCAAFHPLQCRRTPPEGRSPLKRWERVLQAAAGQSGALWLPRLSAPQGLLSFLDSLTWEGERWLATPGDDPGCSTASPLSLPPALVLVGPEGDFSDEEKERILATGFAILPLGLQILRVETAGVAALTRLLLTPPAWPEPGSVTESGKDSEPC